MSSFFRYPGGKSKIKKEIINYIDEYDFDLYIEPFFGGGSIGLEVLKKRNINFLLNDKDFGLSCLWQSVIFYPDELINLIESYIPNVSDFYSFKNELLNLQENMENSKKNILDIGFKKLVIHQISFSGLGTRSGSPLGGKEQKSKYNIDCRWSIDNLKKKINNLQKLNLNKKLFNNKFYCQDFAQLIQNLPDNNKKFMYLDPPYFQKGADLYQYYFTEEKHIELANVLKRLDFSWIMSYDDCDFIRNLYEDFNIKEINISYTINSPKLTKEVLIFSNDS
jgi:DNA adenine methylase